MPRARLGRPPTPQALSLRQRLASFDAAARAVDAAAPAATATVPAGASHRTGTWEVLLGKQFKAYEEAAVQDQIEAAWLADEDQVEVTVRGSCYMLRISASEMVQEAKGDPSRWRSIRRVVR